MTLPFEEPLTVRTLGPRVMPEPLRPGDQGGPPCRICTEHAANPGIWSDDDWVLRTAGSTSLPGAVWLTPRAHHDSFADLPDRLGRAFGPLAGRIERAVLGLGDIARVHVYRYGDGGAHLHVWFVPRPLGMLEAQREMLMLWEDQLAPASAAEIAEAGRRIGAALRAEDTVRAG
jgi:diadenosine tetraphosphate (Ap4A) HIT family hydrolase